MSLLKGDKIQKESMQIASENALHLSAEFEKCQWWGTCTCCSQLGELRKNKCSSSHSATLLLCPGQQFLLWSHSEDTGSKLGVTPESRKRAEDGHRNGEVLGKNYQAFVFPPCSPCCWLCVTWKADWDHSLQLMWKCSLLVRAELSGDKDKAVGGMSAFHFPRGKPSPSGQDSEEREQLPGPSRA